MSDNMNTWNKLMKTDPAATKQVKKGKNFTITAVNAMWQVKRMTEEFGAVGEGWGYTVEYPEPLKVDDTHTAIFADVSVRAGDMTAGPIRGCAFLKTKNKYGEAYDPDASKKAFTDALTKALSHFGMSADVFLGQFDDNKYVSDLKKEFAEKKADAPAYSETTLTEKKRKFLEVYARDRGVEQENVIKIIKETAKKTLGKTEIDTTAEWNQVLAELKEGESK